MSSKSRDALKWVGPLLAALVFAGVAYVIHRELGALHLRDILARLRATPGQSLLLACLATALGYAILGFYDLLALRYIRRRVPAQRVFATAFVAYAFGHNLGLSALTGAAVRIRLYAAFHLGAVDVASIALFCSVTLALGLATSSGIAMWLDPSGVARLLHVSDHTVKWLGAALLAAVVTYILWSSVARRPFEVRGWELRAPGSRLAVAQVFVGSLDLAAAAAVLWWLLPDESPVGLAHFVTAYSAAVIAGIVSHVPGGLGVFESVMLVALPEVPRDALIGAMLAYRAIYYIAPLAVAAAVFATSEIAAQGNRWSGVRAWVTAYLTPVVPQLVGVLALVSGFGLLVSGATPAVGTRLNAIGNVVPLAILELSHLTASIVGVGLLLLARALFRRIDAAYHATFWLLVVGIIASIGKGLDFEEAAALAFVLLVLVAGKEAFHRSASLVEQRFTPWWITSLGVLLACSIFVGFVAHRHVEYRSDLWWTFALHGNAPRMLRASLAAAIVIAGYVIATLLRPARPEPAKATQSDLERAARVLEGCDTTQGFAALSGDKRLLFDESQTAFIMYQTARRSWIALGDPIGPPARHEDLVLRFGELADRHDGRVVFYQASAERLPLYIDVGLAALKLGEEARVPLAEFSLEGPSRASLRQAQRKGARSGLEFAVLDPHQVAASLPALRSISDTWLDGKPGAEKGFSVGRFDETYLQRFPIAVARVRGELVAFANLWAATSHQEISVDLMRFGARAPNGTMDFLFTELMLWARGQGYAWFNLGVAPLSGLDHHPLAPAWRRAGNFVFRHGEHFYNFEGVRRYKAKFDPVWTPRYLVTPGGLALPAVLADVSVLIAGGVGRLLPRSS